MKKIVLSLIVLGFIYALSASEAKAQGDCKNFLGRAREKICQTRNDWGACMGLIKQGTVDVCVQAGSKSAWVRRATFAEAKATLAEKKCKLTGRNSYMCADNYVAYCHGFKNFFSLMAMKDSPVMACEVAPKVEMGDAGGITTLPLHHFYQLKKDFFHWYSANPDSVATMKNKSGYKYVGITGYVFPTKVAGTVELFAAKKSEFGGTNHYLTTDMKSVNHAILNLGWTADGIIGYVAKTQLAETVPLYQLYLPCHGQPNDGKFRAPCEDATGGNVHYYTTSLAEKDHWVKNGMKYMGKAAYIWAKPVTVDQ